MARPLLAFGRFWYRFIAGDDWTIAAGILAGLLAILGLRWAGVDAWWLLPPLALGLLSLSLWRARRPG